LLLIRPLPWPSSSARPFLDNSRALLASLANGSVS